MKDFILFLLTFLIIFILIGVVFRLDFSQIKKDDNASNNILIRFFEKQKDNFNSYDLLDKIIYVLLWIFIVFMAIVSAYLITYLYDIIFFTSEQTPLDAKIPIINPIMRGLILFVYYIFGYILLLALYALLYIFAFWMIIRIFVPIIILFIIPIFPLILPIPLQIIMLETIPPFKKLTDRGILPLMERLMNIIISKDYIYMKFKDVFVETYGFLYDEINGILGDFIKLSIESNKSSDRELYDVPNVSDNVEEDRKKEKKLLDDMKEDKMNKFIKAEYDNCKRILAKNIEYGDEESPDITLDCDFDYLRNYLQNKS